MMQRGKTMGLTCVVLCGHTNNKCVIINDHCSYWQLCCENHSIVTWLNTINLHIGFADIQVVWLKPYFTKYETIAGTEISFVKNVSVCSHPFKSLHSFHSLVLIDRIGWHWCFEIPIRYDTIHLPNRWRRTLVHLWDYVLFDRKGRTEYPYNWISMENDGVSIPCIPDSIDCEAHKKLRRTRKNAM